MASVAVVGLGAMGSRIAQRLLDAGHDLVVWNRSAEKTAPFVAVDTPAQAAEKADAVFVMVSDPQALREVTEGADGILAGARPGTTVIQMSTVGPADVARLASSLPEGVELLDAPVLGSLSEAEGGTLRVFAGGSPDLVEKWTPVLSSLGPVLHVGPVGAGTAAKLVANSTLLGALAVLGEALALGQKLGLSPEATFEVLSATPLAAQAERRREAFETGEYPRRFALALALKDAELISGCRRWTGSEGGRRPSGSGSRRQSRKERARTTTRRSSPTSLLPVVRRQQLVELVVALGDSALHVGLEDDVASLLRLVEHRGRERRLAVLLDEGGRVERLAGVPGIVELLGGDEPLGPHDLAIDAAHPHLVPVGPRHTKR